MIRIGVSTEHEKQELIDASRHIHNLRDIDTDLPMVNFLAHLYMTEELIEIKECDDN